MSLEIIFKGSLIYFFIQYVQINKRIQWRLCQELALYYISIKGCQSLFYANVIRPLWYSVKLNYVSVLCLYRKRNHDKNKQIQRSSKLNILRITAFQLGIIKSKIIYKETPCLLGFGTHCNYPIYLRGF